MQQEKLHLDTKAQQTLQEKLRETIHELEQEHDRCMKQLAVEYEQEKEKRSTELRTSMRQENEAEYDRYRQRSMQKIEAICQQAEDEYTAERHDVMQKLSAEMETSCESALLAMETDHTKEIESLRAKKVEELHARIEDTKTNLLQEMFATQARLRAAFDRDVRTASNMLRELFGQTADRQGKSVAKDEEGWLNSDSYVSKLQHQYGILHEKYTQVSEKLADLGVQYSRQKRELDGYKEKQTNDAAARHIYSKPRSSEAQVMNQLMTANKSLVDKLGNLGQRYTNLENLLMKSTNKSNGAVSSSRLYSSSPARGGAMSSSSAFPVTKAYTSPSPSTRKWTFSSPTTTNGEKGGDEVHKKLF